MLKIKLSIIIPVYNVEKYLEKCLNSICELNISNEIIIVNDGSTDKSLKIAEEFKRNHKNENITIVTQENKGLSEARNTGLKLALGEYVSFIDSDDYVDKLEYETIINKSIEDSLDIGIGRYKKIIFKNDSLICLTDFNKDRQEHDIMSGKDYFYKLYNNNMYGPEVWDDIFRREFLIENNIYFKKNRIHEDEIFTIEVMLKAKQVKYYNIYFYNYVQRNDSIMSTKSIKHYLDMEKNIQEMHVLMINECDERIKKRLQKTNS